MKIFHTFTLLLTLSVFTSHLSCKKAPPKPNLSTPESSELAPETGEEDPETEKEKDTPDEEKKQILLSTAPYTYKRLWRLTPLQLSRSVGTILKKDVPFDHRFDIGSQPEEGFGTEASTLDMDKVTSGKIESIFAKVLESSTKELNTYAPCKIEESIADSCTVGFINQFGEAAFRRPLTTEETNRYKKVYTSVRKLYTTQESLVTVAEAILRSPYTVFRFEVGDAESADDAAPLSANELAAALSYGATDRPPDADLLSAAKNGKLKTQAEISAQVDRLLATDHFIQVYTEFLVRYAGVKWLYKKEKNKDAYTIYNEEMVKAIDKEFRDFVHDNVKEKNADFKILMTNPETRMESRIAKIYGTAESEGFRPFKHRSNPDRRTGLLTLPAVIASNSSAIESGTVHRGNFLKRRLLCEGTAPPPKGLDVKLADSPELMKLPMRKRLVQHSKDPNCAPCHEKMDSIGFSFDNYNAIGGFLEKEKGEPIDASGVVTIGVHKVEFKHGVEFIKKSIELHDVQKCFVKNVFRYVFGRNETKYEEELIESTTKSFAEKNYDAREIFRQLLKSEAYRLRNSPIYKD